MTTKHSKNELSNSENAQLHWGDHNPKLTPNNFINKEDKRSNETSVDLDRAQDEPGRNRKGVKEGETKI